MVGNYGNDIWVEKWNITSGRFVGRVACRGFPAEFDVRTNKGFSLATVTSSIIAGYLFKECQNKLPLDFNDEKRGKPLFNHQQQECSF